MNPKIYEMLQVGDRVTVKSKEWFEKNCEMNEFGEYKYGVRGLVMNENMMQKTGQQLTITRKEFIHPVCEGDMYDYWMLEEEVVREASK